MLRLRERYRQEVLPALMKEYNYRSPMEVPRVTKVVINVGVGEALDNAKALDNAVRDISVIAGQRPVITRARKSIASFKLREGRAIGAKVTLRNQRMYDFLDKLLNTILCRIREFQGVSRNSFDGRGNYTLGFKEQVVFPEIDYDKIDKTRGLEISIVTTAKTDEESRHLLELFGMPFAPD